MGGEILSHLLFINPEIEADVDTDGQIIPEYILYSLLKSQLLHTRCMLWRAKWGHLQNNLPINPRHEKRPKLATDRFQGSTNCMISYHDMYILLKLATKFTMMVKNPKLVQNSQNSISVTKIDAKNSKIPIVPSKFAADCVCISTHFLMSD